MALQGAYREEQEDPFEEHKDEIAAYEKEQAEAPPPDDTPPQDDDAAAKAAAAAAAKAAPPAGADDAEPEDEKAPVPYKALKAERAKRQDLEKNMAEMQEFLADLYRRQQAPAPGTPPADEQPDPDADIDETTDPIGAIQQLRARNARLQAERQQEAAYQQLSTAYMEDARSYAAQTPDFGAAYKHLVNSRGNELKSLGYNNNQINAQIRKEEMEIAWGAFQQRKSPAAVVYEMAKARGYTKAAPPPPPKDVKTAEEIAAEAAAKAAAAFSISPGGKPPAAGELSGADVANLNGEDFDKGFAKLAKAAKKGSGMFRQ